MKSKIKFLALGFLLLFSVRNNTFAFDFSNYFSSHALDVDPGQPDTIYVSCCKYPNFSNVIEIKMTTDNTAPGDSLIGIFVPLVVTADPPQAVLDTHISRAYAGTALEEWSFKAANVFTPGNSYPGDPTVFPMRLIMGGHDLHDADLLPFGKGDHVIARIILTVLESTIVCVDTSSKVGSQIEMHVATTKAEGYIPKWKGNCCVLVPLKGDINIDSEVSLTDVFYLLSHLFRDAENWPLKSAKIADFNCDGSVRLSDVVLLIQFLFKSKPFPCK